LKIDRGVGKERNFVPNENKKTKTPLDFFQKVWYNCHT
jgi:hypothetical protein